MNEPEELTKARELFDDPPAPSARLIAEARARMTNAGADRGLRRPVRQWRPGPRSVGIGLIAATTATVVAVALPGWTSPQRPSQSALQRTQHLAGSRVLLAAALTLERTSPLKSGLYWHQDVISGQAYHAGPRGNGYVIYTRTDNDYWQARSGKEFSYVRATPVGPSSPGDTAAWRRAGSPTRWQVPSDGDDLTLNQHNKPLPFQRPSYVLSPDDGHMGLAERMSLGRDPAAWVNVVRKDDGFVDGSAEELMAGSRYVGDTVVSPQARAAVFRMLAKLPGIRYIGTVTDADGRAGIGLSPPLIHRVDGSVTEYQLILDPRTYAVLGDQTVIMKEGKDKLRPGTVYDYNYTVTEGWTNQPPHQE